MVPVKTSTAFGRFCDAFWISLALIVLVTVPVLSFIGFKAAYVEWKHSDPMMRTFMRQCVIEENKPARRCKELWTWRR
jgi:hypothetical protein